MTKYLNRWLIVTLFAIATLFLGDYCIVAIKSLMEDADIFAIMAGEVQIPIGIPISGVLTLLSALGAFVSFYLLKD